MGILGSDKNIWTLFKIDNVILNPSQFANEFNNYFINATDSLLAEQKNTDAASNFLNAFFSARFSWDGKHSNQGHWNSAYY